MRKLFFGFLGSLLLFSHSAFGMMFSEDFCSCDYLAYDYEGDGTVIYTKVFLILGFITAYLTMNYLHLNISKDKQVVTFIFIGVLLISLDFLILTFFTLLATFLNK